MDWGLARILGPEGRARTSASARSVRASSAELRTERDEQRGRDARLAAVHDGRRRRRARRPTCRPSRPRASVDEIGPHSDVYALGAMLYHLLAGHMPYVPKGARLNNYAVWGLVQQGPPTPIAQLAPRDAGRARRDLREGDGARLEAALPRHVGAGRGPLGLSRAPRRRRVRDRAPGPRRRSGSSATGRSRCRSPPRSCSRSWSASSRAPLSQSTLGSKPRANEKARDQPAQGQGARSRTCSVACGSDPGSDGVRIAGRLARRARQQNRPAHGAGGWSRRAS